MRSTSIVTCLTFSLSLAKDHLEHDNTSLQGIRVTEVLSGKSDQKWRKGLGGIIYSALAKEVIDEDIEFWTRDMGSKSLDWR